MKPTLPLSLLAALLTCVNVSFATETTTPETDTPSTTPTVYQYEQIASGEIPIATDPVTGSAENDYTVKIIGDTKNSDGSYQSSWHVNAKDVTWDTSYTFDDKVLNVGSSLTDSTLSIVTKEGAEEETLIQTTRNLFIGGSGWGISPSNGPLSGKVYVGENATLNVGYNSGGDSSSSQLNVGQAGNYQKFGCEGMLEVDGGTALAGAINVALSRGTKGTITITNGGTVTAERRGDDSNAENYTGSLHIAYYANTTGSVIVEKGSTLTAGKQTYVGMGYDTEVGPATGTLTVTEKSTADLGSMLVIGYYNGSTGTVNVDDSTLTAGTSYLGLYGTGTSGSLTISNNGNASLGNTYLGYYSGTSGEITVTSGATATMKATLIGYRDGSTGKITVDAGNLKAGDAWVGSASDTGELTVQNGGQADFNYIYVGDTLTVDNKSTVNVATDLEVISTATVKVTDKENGASTLTVKGLIDNYGKIEANLTRGGKMEAGSVNNAGTMTLKLANQGSFTADSLTNTGTVSIDITENGTFTVGKYINNGTSTTITAANGTTCQFGSLDLVSGSMILDGPGAFTLGSADAAVATDFYATDTTTATCINISALGENATFTIDPTSLFTINFTDEALSAIAAGDAGDFELNLVLGYDGFIMDASSLETLLGHTSYNVGDQPATLALTETAEETTGLDKTKYTVSNAQYVIKDNNLVWTGTITNNNAVPEPATASLSLLGLAALLMRRRRA